MICEDCAILICNELNLGKQPYVQAVSVLIPTLIKFLSSPIASFRKSALSCLNLFIDFMPELLDNFNLFMSVCYILLFFNLFLQFYLENINFQIWDLNPAIF